MVEKGYNDHDIDITQNGERGLFFSLCGYSWLLLLVTFGGKRLGLINKQNIKQRKRLKLLILIIDVVCNKAVLVMI